MPGSDRPPVFIILAHWPRIVMAVLSAGIAWYAWSRPVSPTWSRPIVGHFPVLGVSRTGKLVTLHQPVESGPAKLQVRDVTTGEIEREFDLAAGRYGLSQVTPDGRWAVIQLDSRVQLMVVSLQTGQLRFPPRYSEGIRSISADSRYAIMWLGDYKLIDLATGVPSIAFDSEVAYFSEDSRQLLIRHRSSQKLEIVNLQDLKVGSLGELPVHPTQPEPKRRIALSAWRDQRVYVSYSVATGPKGQSWSAETWSFDTRNESLSDPRREPDLFRLSDGRDSHSSMWRDGHRGELRRGESWESGGIYERFLQLLVALKIRVKPARILESWQPLDPRTGVPQGAVIHDLDPSFSISPDGHWLVDGRDQLRCWHLPAHRGPLRWLETLLAGLIPGGLVWGICRFKRSKQTGFREARESVQ